MASRSSTSGAQLVVVAALTILFVAGNVHALEIVNNQSSYLTVFAPPICEPCLCGKNCFCPLQCIYRRGVIIKVGERVTLPVRNEDNFYPSLGFLTVEVEGQAYDVKAADHKSISPSATVVVTGEACGEENLGIVALVCRNPNCAKPNLICLVRGVRYGS